MAASWASCSYECQAGRSLAPLKLPDAYGKTKCRMLCRAVADGAMSHTHRQATKMELLRQIRALGVHALFPGGKTEAKRKVDELVAQLKQASDARSADYDGALLRIPLDSVQELLCGDWELVYASQGTALTRSSLAQGMLLASSQLPGVGVKDIQQELRTDPSCPGSMTTTNAAEFSLGLLGGWQVAIEGRWQASHSAHKVKVVFERLKVRPTRYLGFDLPEWLPQVVVPLGEMSQGRSGADWFTTYADGDLRFGEGRAGNIFVFTRVQQQTLQQK